MASEPLLTATPASDLLELRPAGAWISANVAALETLTAAVVPELDRSEHVRLDMAGVSEIDTLGAWLLEKLSRRAAAAGHRAETVGVASNYAGLIEELHQVNRHNPAPVPAQNPLLVKVSDIGRSAVGASPSLITWITCGPIRIARSLSPPLR